MMSQVFIISARPITVEYVTVQQMIDCLLRWQTAAWAGDAYKYCEASDERDRILDELLGESNGATKDPNRDGENREGVANGRTE